MKNITKYFVSMALILSMTSACSNGEENSESTIAPTTTAETTVAETTVAETTEEDVIKALEKELGVSDEIKKAYLEKYSEEDYLNALSCVQQIYDNQQPNSSVLQKIDMSKYNENGYTLESVEITSTFDGHTIPADYITVDAEKNNDTIILVHGYGWNRRMMKDFIDCYLGLGYNVLTYDQRSAGENEASFFGNFIMESYDAVDYINYIDGLVDDEQKIGILGCSMGGGSVGYTLGTDTANSKLDFAILDSPVSGIRDTATDDENNEKYYECADTLTELLWGTTVDDQDIKTQIAKTTVPTLIVTSKADTTVPYTMPQSLYDSMKISQKYIYISEDAGHCGVIVDTNDNYEQLVKDFIDGKLY